MEFEDNINYFLRPASGISQFLRPVIVNTFPTPGLQKRECWPTPLFYDAGCRCARGSPGIETRRRMYDAHTNSRLEHMHKNA